MDKEGIFESLFDEIEDLARSGMDLQQLMKTTCDLLAEWVSYYDWVGFYLVDGENARELVLGPYVGEPTEHTRIGFGQGICGQAAEREETFVVPDVAEQDNYLSCSLRVRSEIVVPIFREGRVVGEIDIDSHTVDPFDLLDRVFLERIASLLGPML